MYGRGMTTRDIQEHLKNIYEVEVSPEFISRVTDSVLGKLGQAYDKLSFKPTVTEQAVEYLAERGDWVLR
jgi:transposase-like protein